MLKGDVAAAGLLLTVGFCVTVGATTEAMAKHLCVVVAEKPYSAFPEALQLVSRLQQAGWNQAAVYDSKYALHLPWGKLLVIADMADERAEAGKMVEALRRRKFSARIEHCRWRQQAEPVRVGKEKGPTQPVTLPSHPVPGCFGWSASKQAAICVTGRQSNEGSKWEVTFPGWEEAKPITIGTSGPGHVAEELLRWNKATAAQVNAQLAEGKFVPLLLPDQQVASEWRKRYEIVRKDQVEEEVKEEEIGAWKVIGHTVDLKCATGVTMSLLSESVEGSNGVELGELPIPPGRLVLFTIRTSWGYHGEFGEQVRARLVDLKRECSH